MKITFEQRKEALHDYLNSIGRAYPLDQLKPESYNLQLVIVNLHSHKYGDSPNEVQATADQLHKDLVRIFGDAAAGWTSDFLQLQEIKYQKLLPQVNDARKDLDRAFDALPEIVCYGKPGGGNSSMGGQHKLKLRREMLDPSIHRFKVKVPSKVKGRPPLIWEYSVVGFLSKEQLANYSQILDQVDCKRSTWEGLKAELDALRSYRNLEPVIRASFDWPKQHDNDMAGAYQAIANPLWLIATESKWNDGKYQSQLRLAFDGKPIEDERQVSEVADAEFLVLHKGELLDALTTNIKETIWAFKAEFLAEFMPIRASAIKMIQKVQNEDCYDEFLELLGDRFSDFVNKAVEVDGPGQFLSQYDGKMIEHEDWRIFAQNINWDECE